MPETVKIISVSEGKPWEDLTFYDIVFERNGSDFSASWGKKSTGAPQAGEQVEGEFYKDKNDRWRFRKASKPAGSFSGGGSGGGKRDWTPESQRDPERSARILRQHSQGLAVQILLAEAGERPNEAWIAHLKDKLPAWCDFLDQDVIQAAKQGADKSGGAEPLSSPSPASRTAPAEPRASSARDGHSAGQQLEEDENAHQLGDFLNRLGVIDPDDCNWLVRAWEALNEDKRTAALKQLTNAGDLEGQNVALKRLWQLAGPVPGYFRDKDPLPF